MTVVAQLAKAPGIHGYIAGSIPDVIPRYCTIKNNKCSLEHQKKEKKEKELLLPLARCHVRGKKLKRFRKEKLRKIKEERKKIQREIRKGENSWKVKGVESAIALLHE